jgi:hypothetical protein
MSRTAQRKGTTGNLGFSGPTRDEREDRGGDGR